MHPTSAVPAGAHGVYRAGRGSILGTAVQCAARGLEGSDAYGHLRILRLHLVLRPAVVAHQARAAADGGEEDDERRDEDIDGEAHLSSQAIGGHRWSSEVIGGHQRSSGGMGDNLGSSDNVPR